MSGDSSMNESGQSVQCEGPDQALMVSAGAMIRGYREKSGVHIAALAVALKIPVRKLEALEADQWGQLSDLTFVRALAASVCRHLKADPVPVLALLPAVAKNVELPQTNVGPTFPREVVPAAVRFGSGPLPHGLIVAVAILLVGAAILWFWPFHASVTNERVSNNPGGASRAEVSALPAVSEAVVDRAKILQPSPQANAERSMPNREMGTTTVPSSIPAMATAQLNSGRLVSPQTIDARTLPPVDGAGSDADASVVFSVSDSSWVRVVDNFGAPLISRMLAPGETVRVAGRPPLGVTVGNSDATRVMVQGKAFDLKVVAKDNVARFEVK